MHRLTKRAFSRLVAVSGAVLMWAVGSPGLADEAIQESETQGFGFALNHCKLKGKNIVCAFTVTSAERDQDLAINRDTRMFDDSGNEYALAKVEIANKSGGTGLRSLFVAGIPTAVRLHFVNVSIRARAIALLELKGAGPKGALDVKFRDVPLEQ